MYPDPTQLGRGHPVKTVTGLSRPYSIAFNSRGEMVVSERVSDRISVLNNSGQRIRSFGSGGSPHLLHSLFSRPEKIIIRPAGIAIDDKDNVYVGMQ